MDALCSCHGGELGVFCARLTLIFKIQINCYCSTVRLRLSLDTNIIPTDISIIPTDIKSVDKFGKAIRKPEMMQSDLLR